jgi:RNA-splicing ligase RtcB
VPFEDAARAQVERVATLPLVHDHVAIMPDVHWGIGARDSQGKDASVIDENSGGVQEHRRGDGGSG